MSVSVNVCTWPIRGIRGVLLSNAVLPLHSPCTLGQGALALASFLMPRVQECTFQSASSWQGVLATDVMKTLRIHHSISLPNALLVITGPPVGFISISVSIYT